MKRYEALCEISGLLILFASFTFQIKFKETAQDLTQFWRDQRENAVYDTIVGNRSGAAHMEKADPFHNTRNYAGAQRLDKQSGELVSLSYALGTAFLIIGRVMAHARERRTIIEEEQRPSGLTEYEKSWLRIGNGRR